MCIRDRDGTTDDGCALVLENVPAAGLRAALEAVPEPDALTPNDIAELEDYLEKAKRGDV